MQKKPIEWNKWKERGIKKIGDLLNEEGNFLSQDDINKIYKVKCNFLELLQIRLSIHSLWWETIYGEKKRSVLNAEVIYYCNGSIHELSTVTCKDIYWSFIHHRKRDPSCVKKWAVAYPGFKNATEELWTNIFRLSFSITRETKLQSFQYRLIHRTITCRKRLFEMKMADHPRCLYCKDIDDIKHFFLFCPKVQSFWNSFFLWWNNLGDIIIPPEYECLEECMIFGFQPRG